MQCTVALNTVSKTAAIATTKANIEYTPLAVPLADL